MFRTPLFSIATLAGVALLACVKGEQTSQSPDSTARNLTLAPTESTAAMKDVPARAQERATREPEKARAPKPVAAAPLRLAAGTSVPLAANDTITTRAVKAGDAFSASVSADVHDASGRTVIPKGSTVSGTIATSNPGPNGQLELNVSSVTVHGQSYAIDASVVAKDTVMKGRGVTTGDAEKVGGGAVAGALVGRLLGKNAKGTLIGGAVGAAAGAAVARATRSIDIVIPKGAAITIKLNAPLTLKRA
ncbi:MAG TPA: glycine zipper domain-containing protein [Gemmatimonadales bacterium]|nr:glycine zipper domain-containing protein [Gemmatimonadales bacterium]